MKRTIIFMLILAGLQVVDQNSDWSILTPTQVQAQVMNKETVIVVDKVPAEKFVTCPYCKATMSLQACKKHMIVCPYRFCIEYTYDAAGNRIRRAVVWTVSPIVEKKIELIEEGKITKQKETDSDL